mmetsp:Transcript_9744/g.13408  ORF Transcript_9744/g.13408 Transcript_9744/m.13408 type:complete len:90 (+) Transcript_9744:531-800(+)
MLVTGISAIDILTPIARGQSVAIIGENNTDFCGLAERICTDSKLAAKYQKNTIDDSDENCAIVFGGIRTNSAMMHFFNGSKTFCYSWNE